MPGFNSFLFGHGPFTALKQDTPPPSDEHFEPKALKKACRQQERIRAQQVADIYGYTMTRKDAEYIYISLTHLKSDIDTQIELFHDAGLLSPEQRHVKLSRFVDRNQLIVKDGAAILQRVEPGTGLVDALAKGVMELGRRTVANERHGVPLDWMTVHNVVAVYQTSLKEPVAEMVWGVGKILGREGAWKDLE